MKIDTDKLKFLMISQQLTFRQLAKLAAISESKIYALATGKKATSTRLDIIGRIAAALDVDASAFVVLD